MAFCGSLGGSLRIFFSAIGADLLRFSLDTAEGGKGGLVVLKTDFLFSVLVVEIPTSWREYEN